MAQGARQLIPEAERAVLYLERPQGDGPALRPVAAAGFSERERVLLVGQEDEEVDESLREALFRAAERHAAGGPVQGPTLGFPSVLAAPVERRRRRLGLLTVKSSPPEAFSDEDEILLKMLGRQAAMAIENAHLFQAQQQERRTAETLREANQALSETLELPTVLETPLDFMQSLVGYEQAIVILRRRRQQLHLVAWRGVDSPAPDGRLFYEEEAPLLARVWKDNSTTVVTGEEGRSPWLARVVNRDQAGSWLAAPLVAGEQAIGALILGSRSSVIYSEEQATLAGTLAAQATIAINNARLFTQVQSSQIRLRRLSRKVVIAQEEERLWVARELYDEAGQALTALKMTLEMIHRDSSGSAAQQIEDAMAMTDETMEQIRRLAHDLHPPVLDAMGLADALEGLARDFAKRAKFEITFDSDPIPEWAESIGVSPYRFAQEALTNVARHASADKVSVELRRRDDIISETIADDGKGFDLEEVMNSVENDRGIGLTGMQECIELLNGWVDIDSSPGEGRGYPDLG